MPRGAFHSVVGHLHRIIGLAGANDATDRQLLERFAAWRDEAAFATLVRRHGGMVQGVCNRVLRDRSDAEDVFQATFLVLACKAGSIRWDDSVGNWLYQVAFRLAVELRGKTARRRALERAAMAMPKPEPVSEGSLHELGAVLDEELQRLPEKCRAPMLMCYLEGATRDQAAQRLGWSVRTLERRLEAGRALLRTRLTARGVTLSAALLAVGLSQNSTSAALASATAGAASTFAAGARPAAIAATSSRVIALAEGALQAMSIKTVRLVTALALVLGLLATGTGVLTGQSQQAKGPRAPEVKPEPVAAPVKPLAQARGDTEAKTEAALAAGLQWLVRQQATDGRWSLDGNNAMKNDVAATAFGLLPLLRAGETHKAAGQMHPYTRTVDRGLRFLLKVQKSDGDFGGGMYTHALATLAVCEAWQRTRDPLLKPPAQRAIDFIVKAQHPAGGWRYAPGQPGDTSVSSWQIVALHCGQAAGIKVPKITSERAAAFLDSVATPDGSAYGYFGRAPGSPAMTAAGVLCRELLGWGPRHPGLVRGIATIKQLPPARTTANLYYYHYATLAMAGSRDEDWQFWEPKMRRLLLETQDQDPGQAGHKGSWSPQGDPWGTAGGRVMTTSLALLTLQTCAGQDVPPPPGPPRELTAKDLERLWNDLADEGFFKARQSMRILAAVPAQTVPFLKGQLRPAPPVDSQGIARLIGELDDPKFTVRENAVAGLKQFGELAELALRKSLENQPSLEVRRRVEHLLAGVERLDVSADRVRLLRAVEVLGQVGTSEARRVLEDLARGAPEARLTQEARTVLERLRKRPAATP